MRRAGRSPDPRCGGARPVRVAARKEPGLGPSFYTDVRSARRAATWKACQPTPSRCHRSRVERLPPSRDLACAAGRPMHVKRCIVSPRHLWDSRAPTYSRLVSIDKVHKSMPGDGIECSLGRHRCDGCLGREMIGTSMAMWLISGHHRYGPGADRIALIRRSRPKVTETTRPRGVPPSGRRARRGGPEDPRSRRLLSPRGPVAGWPIPRNTTELEYPSRTAPWLR